MVGVQPCERTGLSSSYAAAFGAANFTAWVVNRVDTRLKDLWHNSSHLQMHWQPEGADGGVFTHVLDTHYGSPSIVYKGTSFSFDFEVFGGLGGGSNAGSQVPVSDRSPSVFYDSTLDEIAEAYVAIARLRASWYRQGPPWQRTEGECAVLIPFGDDMRVF